MAHSSRPLRFGLLGRARIIRRGVLAGLRRAADAEPWAIASRNAAVAEEWAKELEIPRHYGSYEALLADPDIDAVYIPLPNELHRVWALRAAEAGKHVLCEKPLGLDAADAEQIVDGCRRHGVMLMEAFMWRHHPRTLHAIEMVRTGLIGELRLVKMDFSFDIDRSDWRLDPTRGGGALYDIGCYGLNAARLFTGEEPAEVVARARYFDTGVDSTMSFQLVFPSGAMALVDCSFECPYRNRLEIVGTTGALEFSDGVLPAPEAELLLRRDNGVETISFDDVDQYAEEIAAFCTAIRSGVLPTPAEDGLKNMQALERIRNAAQQIGS